MHNWVRISCGRTLSTSTLLQSAVFLPICFCSIAYLSYFIEIPVALAVTVGPAWLWIWNANCAPWMQWIFSVRTRDLNNVEKDLVSMATWISINHNTPTHILLKAVEGANYGTYYILCILKVTDRLFPAIALYFTCSRFLLLPRLPSKWKLSNIFTKMV